MTIDTQGAPANGFRAVSQPIGREHILEAQVTLQKYKQGKANLEQRIIENEQWYKLRHWECMRKKDTNQVEPVSAWLFNCLANKHADAMDNFPSPNILPREEGDQQEAKMLSSIVPVVLEQNGFEETYDNEQDYKLKMGTGVYGVFWDKDKLNGLGDISVKKLDLLNLFWEPGVTDIQKSKNVFHVELVENDTLKQVYPELESRLGSATADVATYIYDDSVDTSTKSAVVDWYYKKRVGRRTVLHYVKYVNDVVLYASENDPQTAERGFYDDGEYPFVFDVLFSMEGCACGFGYIDVGKSTQEYIDRGNQAIMQNMLSNARPRYFVRKDGAVNKEQFADMTNDIIEVEGPLSQDTVMPVQGKPLSDIYVNVILNKVEELKETTGNRDVSTGGTTSGVTAGAAIAAMQEAGSKLSRDSNKGSYRAFRKVVLKVIERIRQFYNLSRMFRIIGENGAAEYVSYSNAGIKPQHQGSVMGVDTGYRVPLFDVEVTAQKASPYSRMSQNELALQFYNAGFFNPQMADQALACLGMMDFDRKESIMQKIAQNGGMYQQMLHMQQQMLQLAQIVDSLKGTNLAQQIAAGVTGAAAPPTVTGEPKFSSESQEAPTVKKARQQAAEATSPT